MWFRRLAYDLTHPLIGSVSRSRAVVQRLFGVAIPPALSVQFDPTTLLLKQALFAVSEPADRSALEVGIGQGALLAIGLAQTRSIRVDGVDLSPERVRSSRTVAEFNGVSADFFTSDLFASVPLERRYDLIFFNPPYVPTVVGKQLSLTRRMRVESDAVWDGGTDGTELIRRFASGVAQFLSPRGRALFGFQRVFVSETRVAQILAETSLSLQRRFTKWYIPSVVYVASRPRQGKPCKE